jgi:hypothetical protein
MRKTKREIIQETAEFYNAKNRAVRSHMGCDMVCVYFDPETGNKCAVGRCLNLPNVSIVDLKGYVDIFTGSIGSRVLEDILMEEYKGHLPQFWDSLQSLHDREDYWNAEGMSEEGKLKYEKLLKEWG